MLVMTVCFQLLGTEAQESRRNNRNRQRNRNAQRNNENGMNPVLHRAYVNAVTGGGPTTSATTTVPGGWEQSIPEHLLPLIPTLPAPADVECFVEVTTVERQGGRCIRTGGRFNRPYFCQSGRHLFLDNSCEEILNNRENPVSEPST